MTGQILSGTFPLTAIKYQKRSNSSVKY
ncbi:ABC transporter permease [Clostridium cadaveris]